MFLFKNDFGVDIILTVTDQNCSPVDVSGATVREFEFKKPDGSISLKTAVFVTTGVDGQLKYTVESGFLNVVGTWTVRAKLTHGATKVYRTAEVVFSVKN